VRAHEAHWPTLRKAAFRKQFHAWLAEAAPAAALTLRVKLAPEAAPAADVEATGASERPAEAAAAGPDAVAGEESTAEPVCQLRKPGRSAQRGQAPQQSPYPEHPVTVGYRRSTAVQARRRWEGAHKQPGFRSRRHCPPLPLSVASL